MKKGKDFDDLYIPVPEAGCWLWLGTVNSDGYGESSHQKPRLAHRFSWQHFHGDIPPGMFVCHKCDVPSCINPNHLFLGTPKDNSDDRVLKGRSRLRDGRGFASKLKVEDIAYILQSSLSALQLARRFGVTDNTIYRARKKGAPQPLYSPRRPPDADGADLSRVDRGGPADSGEVA